MRILVVDDDAASRMLLKRSVERWGHEVTLAEDGESAWAKHLAEPFPVVISDWVMPVMDGLDLCRRVRALPLDRYTFFILLTAKSDHQSLVSGLEAGADDFVSKPFDPAELKARIRSGERILELEAQLAIRIGELARANLSMIQDLEAAAQVQQAMLPTDLPRIPQANVAWRLKPCEELAGDIFNAFLLGPERLGVYLLDVSGHGVASALLSITLSRLLSPTPGQSALFRHSADSPGGYDIRPPAEVLGRLNADFQIKESAGSKYFTIIYGILDLANGRFTYSIAGHPGPAIALADGSSRSLEGGGLPIGFYGDAEYENYEARLGAGDRVVLYSDGVVEAAKRDCSQFGVERLLERIAASRAAPLEESLDRLLAEVFDWCQPDKPLDDISLLALEWGTERRAKQG